MIRIRRIGDDAAGINRPPALIRPPAYHAVRRTLGGLGTGRS
jgi:hypothetical protein